MESAPLNDLPDNCYPAIVPALVATEDGQRPCCSNVHCRTAQIHPAPASNPPPTRLDYARGTYAFITHAMGLRHAVHPVTAGYITVISLPCGNQLFPAGGMQFWIPSPVSASHTESVLGWFTWGRNLWLPLIVRRAIQRTR